MNLQQFRFVRETIRRNFNLTEAARALYTSQPGVSKAIIEFEDELGIKIFERHGKRLKGLTKPGQVVSVIIDRIMREVDNLKKVSDEFARRDEGALVIACTHTQARYLLPRVIPAFRERFPKVHVSLAEGNPEHLAQLVLHEQADVAIATETLAQTPGLVALPVYTWEHTLVVPPDHPLAELTSSAARSLSLEHLSRYPIVTYDRHSRGAGRSMRLSNGPASCPTSCSRRSMPTWSRPMPTSAWESASSRAWPSIRAATRAWSACPPDISLASTPPRWPSSAASSCATTCTCCLKCWPRT